MRIVVWANIVLAIVCTVSCRVVPPQPDPFTLPESDLFDSVRTVVVASTSLVGDLEIPDSVLAAIDSLLEGGLAEADFSIIPAVEYAAIWDRIVSEAGGFYDPYTGDRNEERFAEAVDALHTELAESSDYDAVAYAEVWEVTAPFDNGRARWGGVARPVTGGAGYSGDILASTLYLVIEDVEGNELYAREAGIALLEYMVRGQLLPIGSERLFADSTTIPDAVARVLAPLVQARSGFESNRRLPK